MPNSTNACISSFADTIETFNSSEISLAVIVGLEYKKCKRSSRFLDFLIFDSIDKSPRLVVEVDGVKFHAEGTRQAGRDSMKNSILSKYGLPLLRFRTDGSDEREKLNDTFSNILNLKN